jgi:pilus assembly protein FimV
MRHTPLLHSIRALAGAALIASAAQAAELGDITTRSYIGQPLAADIELVSLTPDEINALQVRLAQPDVFRGANVTMNPALSSVRLSVVKRDQKQFLHVTTTRAIDADYVHLYVELSAAGRQEVRLATVWLQADPNPAPAAAPAVPLASAMTSSQAEQIAAQARAERAARAAAVPAAASVQLAPPLRDRTRPAPMPSAHESEVGGPAGMKSADSPAVRRAPPVSVRDLPQRIAGVMVTPRGTPVKPVVKEDEPAAEAAVPVKVAQALLPMPPLPLPKGVKRPAPSASCAPSGITAKECQALDQHNAELSSKLLELEGKLKVLQGAVGGSAAAAGRTAAHGAPAAAPASATAPASASAVAKTAPAAASAPAAVPSPGPASGKTSSSASSTASAPAPGKVPASPASASASGASAPVKAAAGPASAPALAAGSAQAASAAASATAPATSASAASVGKAVHASASASARGELEAHAAKAAVDDKAASAEHAASASASAAASVPVKQVRVLPKLKYKKEKPAEKPSNYTLPISIGVAGLLMLAGAGYIYLRKKNAGSGPLKIWQGFRKKKVPEAKPEEAQPLHEVTPESLMQ